MGTACSVSAVDDDSTKAEAAAEAARSYGSSESSVGSSIKECVVVLRANGEVMRIGHKIRAGELMRDFPQHFLCPATTVLIRRKSKMIPPKAMLQRGKIYLLLPYPVISDKDEQDTETEQQSKTSCEDTNPLLGGGRGAPPPTGTTKFVISKVYLDRILSCDKKRSSSGSGSSKKKSSLRRSSGKDSGATPLQRRSSITWSPALESIPEK